MRAVMKGELFRLFKSRIFYILIAVLSAVLICLVKYYDNYFYYQNGYNGYDILRYELDELPEIISEHENLIAETERWLEGNLTTMERERLTEETETLRTQLNVYRYLYEHKIVYADYQDFAGMRNYYGDNAISAFTTICEQLNAILPFVFSLFAIWMIAWDYFCGTYKFLYSTQIPRRRIMSGRYVTWLIVSAVGVLLCCTAAACLGFLFGNGGGIVIFANVSGAFGLNHFGIFCLEFADIVFRTLAVGSMTFGLAMLWKNVLLPAFPSLMLCIATFFAYAVSEVSPLLSVLLGGIPYVFIVNGIPSLYILYVVFIGIAFALACLSIGIIHFTKKDLK
ncbi:MAG: hypothetical protein ACI3XS_07270 [Eubacteriales bacterium]